MEKKSPKLRKNLKVQQYAVGPPYVRLNLADLFGEWGRGQVVSVRLDGGELRIRKAGKTKPERKPPRLRGGPKTKTRVFAAA